MSTVHSVLRQIRGSWIRYLRDQSRGRPSLCSIFVLAVRRSRISEQEFQHLLNESATFNDLLVLDADDSYRLIMLKLTSAMAFYLEHCYEENTDSKLAGNSPLFLKMDEDPVVNPAKLLDILPGLSGNGNRNEFMAGSVFRNASWGPIRDSSLRDYVPTDIYPHSLWLFDFLSGPAYFLSPLSVKRTFEYVRCLPATMTYDDVDITGLLRIRLHIPIIDLTQFWFPAGISEDVRQFARANAAPPPSFHRLTFAHYSPQLADDDYAIIWNYFDRNFFFNK